MCLSFFRIYRFINNYSEGCGWIVKAPFTTNCDCRIFCHSLEKVMSAVSSAETRFGRQFSYLMLQPVMQNRREEKVVLFNGEPCYIADKSINPTQSGSKFADSQQLLAFAAHAVRLLKSRDRLFLCDGLVRVDLFCNSSMQLVVNEFESLEANYTKSPFERQAKVTEQLAQYWEDVLRRCLSIAVCSKMRVRVVTKRR